MANELTWHDVLAEEKQQPYFLITDRDRRMVWHFPFAPALRHRRHC